MEEKTCPLCGNRLRSDNKRGWCTAHITTKSDGGWRFTNEAYALMLKKGLAVAEENRPTKGAAVNGNSQAAPRVAKPRRAPKAPDSAPAIPQDVVGILQRQREALVGQLARIDKAIAALAE